MKKLILIAAFILVISALGAVCLVVNPQILREGDFSGMPDGRVYSGDEGPYPYLPTQPPKENRTLTPPIEPPD
jgi:hypothetical protein